MSTDHLEPNEVVPPPFYASTHHFDCDGNICRSVTIDKRTGDIHITHLVRGSGINRVILSPEQFLALSIHVGATATKEIHKEHMPLRAVKS